jgi:predicted esterase
VVHHGPSIPASHFVALVRRACMRLLAGLLLTACTRAPAPAVAEPPLPLREVEVALAVSPGNAEHAAEVSTQWESPRQWVVLRDAENHPIALVSTPTRPKAATSVVVSIHGSQSNPEWNCPKVRDAYGDTPWIVCPHPIRALGTDATWQNAAQVKDAVEKSLALLHTKIAQKLNAHFIGHSSGAMLAPSVLGSLPSQTFETATLFEGQSTNPKADAALLLRAGVTRVILMTGSSWSLPGTKALEHALTAAAPTLDVRRHQGTFGHFYGPEVNAWLHADFPDLALATEAAESPTKTTLPLLDAVVTEEIFFDGKRAALVDVPKNVREQRPIVIATHAAGVGPEWICSAARQIFGPRPFLVCPDEAPGPNLQQHMKEALVLRFGAYIDDAHASYFGYSQGAIMALNALGTRTRTYQFRTALFLEGVPPSNAALVDRMAGFEHVLIVSGQSSWAAKHADLATKLSANGIDAKHIALTFGHVPTDAIVTEIAQQAQSLAP